MSKSPVAFLSFIHRNASLSYNFCPNHARGIFDFRLCLYLLFLNLWRGSLIPRTSFRSLANSLQLFFLSLLLFLSLYRSFQLVLIMLDNPIYLQLSEPVL